jgi:hypothetical protein
MNFYQLSIIIFIHNLFHISYSLSLSHSFISISYFLSLIISLSIISFTLSVHVTPISPIS